MDGYSVQEAASVLGVAEGRVWELLARGVLLGTPEGDSMRVFLKAQPGPLAATASREEPPRTNGNGGSHGSSGEASAFRELLTEFRNLTERYGQALLALGEARGEVAGLRSRVDLLEARLDLRLPTPVEATPFTWESAGAPTVEEPEVAERAAPSRSGTRRGPRPRKAPSARETVAGFAEALARAQDPNAADLGGRALEAETEMEASAPPAEVDAPPESVPEPEMDEVASDDVAADVSPAALEAAAAVEEAPSVAEASAEPAADEVAAPEPQTYSAVVVEPDWFADGDFAWLDAADLEASGEVAAGEQEEPASVPETEAAPVEPPSADVEAAAARIDVADLPAEPEVATAPEEPPTPLPSLEAAPELPPTPPLPSFDAAPELPPAPSFEAAPEAEVVVEFETWQPPAPVEPESEAEPPRPETSAPPAMAVSIAAPDVEEEVMWLGAGPDPERTAAEEPGPDLRGELEAWPAADRGPSVAEMVRPPLAMTEDELARLALDEGWDDAEVAAIRAMITPPPTVDLPGATELHEAMAALEAVPVRSDPAFDASRQWAKPLADDEMPAPFEDWAFEAEPASPPPPPRPPIDVAATLRRGAADPSWLRRRQGPAAAAYRRLRRLFTS
jgi:hypothetical protein